MIPRVIYASSTIERIFPGGHGQHERVGNDEMGERFRGGVSEGEFEHFTGVQGAFDPGQAEVQSEPGIETSPQAIIATAPTFEFSQQQRTRPVPGSAAASAADP